MIWWIILLILWIIVTEFIFFSYAKDNHDFGDSFLSRKSLSLFVSGILVFFSVGLPAMFAFLPREQGLEPFGIIAYAWYYGIIFAFIIFFGINYAIHKWLERKGK